MHDHLAMCIYVNISNLLFTNTLKKNPSPFIVNVMQIPAFINGVHITISVANIKQVNKL